MAKNDFDMDFDFEKEYGFDPNEFLDADDNADIDFSEFDDDVPAGTSDRSDDEFLDFDLDDLDLDDLDLDGLDLDGLDLGEEAPEGEFQAGEYEEESYVPAEQEAYPGDVYDSEPEYAVGPEVISAGRRSAPAYQEEEENFLDDDFDEDTFEQAVYGSAQEEAPAEEPFEEQPEEAQPQEELEPREPRLQERAARRRPAPTPKPQKERVPREKTGPNIFEKIIAFYMAPLKEEEAPQDPNNPRRRRRKRTKMQIFKEVYLPPIIAAVTLVMILVFVMGSISNAIAQKKLENEAAMLESQSASEEQARLEEEAKRVLADAERLAMGYDYAGAAKLLESYGGEMTQEMNQKRAEYVNMQSKLVEWKDYSSIANLSFHVLIADPQRAFNNDPQLKGQYNRNFVTIDEFSKILDQLYKGGYVLVDFDSFTETNTGLDGNANFFTKPIALPEGKKPIMLTETMVNYFGYMVDSNDDGEPDAGGSGFAYRLIVDNNGDIRAQMVDANGQTQTGNYDLVPILEDFIKEHPDFSYQGARAILAVSGSEGVFGYRTNTSYISTISQGYYDEQVAGAKTIVQALRDKGYTIACYTYDNVAYGDRSATQIQADMKDWTNQITPVIGEVDTLVYARTSDIGDYSGAKFQVLHDCGFRFFLRHGSAPSAEINNTYVKQSRLMVTGENMAWKSDQFSNYFDCAAILNNLRGNVPKG